MIKAAESCRNRPASQRIGRVAVFFFMMMLCAPTMAKEVTFSGYNWTVKSGSHLGPGPNDWGEDNAWVDADGHLHLALTNGKGQWNCAQVSMLGRLGFGRYQFWVIGPLARLDPNVVFGLFSYPTADVGPDGTREIDIEFARWGSTTESIVNYTVWPARIGFDRVSKRLPIEASSDFTTHRFIWHAGGVEFQSLNGHRDDEAGLFSNWVYRPSDPASHIGDQPLPVQINLWLYKGEPPRNRQPIEIIVRSFSFFPG